MKSAHLCSLRDDAAAGMRLVREELERLLTRRHATALLLDAMGSLERWGELSDPEGLRHFVEGPVRLALSERLGPVAAAEATQRLGLLLRRMPAYELAVE